MLSDRTPAKSLHFYISDTSVYISNFYDRDYTFCFGSMQLHKPTCHLTVYEQYCVRGWYHLPVAKASW